MTSDFSIGDRVGISALGAARSPRLAERTGTIVGRGIYTNSFVVLFDGNKTTSLMVIISKRYDRKTKNAAKGDSRQWLLNMNGPTSEVPVCSR